MGGFSSQLFQFLSQIESSQMLYMKKLSNDLKRIKWKKTLFDNSLLNWFIKFEFAYCCVFQTEEGCVWPHTGEETDGVCR